MVQKTQSRIPPTRAPGSLEFIFAQGLISFQRAKKSGLQAWQPASALTSWKPGFLARCEKSGSQQGHPLYRWVQRLLAGRLAGCLAAQCQTGRKHASREAACRQAAPQGGRPAKKIRTRGNPASPCEIKIRTPGPAAGWATSSSRPDLFLGEK